MAETLEDILCYTCWRVWHVLGETGAMMERLERSREACRNVCEALGMKPMTAHLSKWWQIVTTAQVAHNNPQYPYTRVELVP